MQIGLKQSQMKEVQPPGGDETPVEKDPEVEQPDLKNLTASQLLNHNKLLEKVEKVEKWNHH